MRFLADECLHVAIVAALRAAGHEVSTVQAIDAGAGDRVVLQRALSNRAILLTADKDFGRIVIAHGLAASGIVLFRRSARHPDRAAARLLAAIDEHGERLYQLYVVIAGERTRVRAMSLALADEDVTDPTDG
jgi:predicted nuclease of predicted toxin-antitoxin system